RPHPREPGKYEIIAGERRWRAAASARLHEIPVEVRSVGDAEMFEIALVENIQREDLSAIEEADGYDRLMKEFGYTQETLAKRVGKSRAHIANTLRLGGLPEPVREMVIAGKLTAGHARALLTAPDPRALAEEAVSRSLSVRDVERLANLRKASAGMRKKGGRPSKAEAAGGGKATAKDADTSALERDLTTRLGLRVEISGGEPGTVVVRYGTLEQLDDLVQRLLA
ncbi:MAG: ParB/RepB/Spo0J family partition protein, partial [Alphaproteobacteria bacterium]|nr:ParB/RepB/Spo0J family partition protein [Alphaproteobacteria bacterium]